MENLVLCDTNIFIELFNGSGRITDELQRIEEQNIAISVVFTSELVYGALNKVELAQILRALGGVRTLPLNESIGELQLELLTSYSLSHNLNLPDALIAATAIHYQVPLFTLNLKDFRYLEQVHLYTPSWVGN